MTASASPRSVTLSYTDDGPGYRRIVEQVGSFDQLLERLRAIQARRTSDLSVGVNLEDQSDHELAVGMANGMWTVIYSDPGHTELLYSLGDAEAEGDVELRFEQWEAVPKRYFIPADKAAEVIRMWFTTGELSRDIEWERLSLLWEGD